MLWVGLDHVDNADNKSRLLKDFVGVQTACTSSERWWCHGRKACELAAGADVAQTARVPSSRRGGEVNVLVESMRSQC